MRLPYPTAVLVSDGWLEQAVVVLLACHISTRSARSGCGSREDSQENAGVCARQARERSPGYGSREDSQENASLEKCHCSAYCNPSTHIVLAKQPVEHVRD